MKNLAVVFSPTLARTLEMGSVDREVAQHALRQWWHFLFDYAPTLLELFPPDGKKLLEKILEEHFDLRKAITWTIFIEILNCLQQEREVSKELKEELLSAAAIRWTLSDFSELQALHLMEFEFGFSILGLKNSSIATTKEIKLFEHNIVNGKKEIFYSLSASRDPDQNQMWKVCSYMKNIEGKNLFKVIWPFLLTFLIGRIITQTDLIFATMLGSEATAAFGVPLRISIIDAILAFSLAPIISVYVAEATDLKTKESVITQCLSLTFYLSLLLTIVGLLVYPLLTRMMVSDVNVISLAQPALIWLTLSIPFRFLYMAVSMALHGLKLGRYLLWIGLFNIFSNLILNFVFVFILNWGFKGIYSATFITSVFSVLWAFGVLIKKGKIDFKFILLDWKWIKAFLKLQSFETLRVFSERVLSLVELAMVGTLAVHFLDVFSVGSEFILLMFTPFVAVLRGTSIELSSLNIKGVRAKFKAIEPLFSKTFWILSWLVVPFAFFHSYIGKNIYALNASSLVWWHPLFIIVALSVPLKWGETILRSILISEKKLYALVRLDILADWFLALPIFILGLKMENPWVCWSSLLFATILKLACLLKYTRK